MQMYFLILGGQGYIGRVLVNHLIKSNLKYQILPRWDGISQNEKEIILAELKFNQLESRKKEFGKLRIINLIARAGNSFTQDEIKEANFVAPYLIFQDFMGKNIDFDWIQISSYFQFYSFQYGKEKNSYSLWKNKFTKLLTNEIKNQNSRTFLEIFLPHVYGEKEKQERIFPLLLKCRRENMNLSLTSGNQFLPFIYIEDCVAAIINILKINSEMETICHFYVKPERELQLREIVSSVLNPEITKQCNFGVLNERENEFYSHVKVPNHVKIFTTDIEMNYLKYFQTRSS